MFGKMIKFVKESISELGKVTWLTKDEALKSSLVVIMFVVIFSLFLSFVDYAVNLLVTMVVK